MAQTQYTQALWQPCVWRGNFDHRKLAKLLMDRTLKFDQHEIDEIVVRFTEPDEWKYTSKRQNAALRATYRVILDDGRFPDDDNSYRNSVRSICRDDRQPTDILEVVLAQQPCPSEVYDSVYESLYEMVYYEREHMLQYVLNLNWFNVNRYWGLRQHKDERLLHCAVDLATKRRNQWPYTPVRMVPYTSNVVKMILACPNIQPNRRARLPPIWESVKLPLRTPLDQADCHYNQVVADIANAPWQFPVVDGQQRLNDAAHNVFLLLSHDDVDIHTIGDSS